MGKMQNDVLEAITKLYLNSGDFNGLPLEQIVRDFGMSRQEVKGAMRLLIEKGLISLNFGDRHPNPHIKAFPAEEAEIQERKLEEASDLRHVCAYPTRCHLAKMVDPRDYPDEPFTLRLALGEPQLSFLAFELSVLEVYRNDPRYDYSSDDISGTISVWDEYFESEAMPASDQVLLEHFGFAYDPGFNRAVAVYLRYLSRLSPEHQQIWQARLVKGEYELHPDYYLSSMGHWPEHISVFDAFLEELHHINQMCKLIGKPLLFRNELKDRPRSLSFLIRPTLKEFNGFVHTLDKAISENLNRAFFAGDIPLEDERLRKDGKVVVQQKGTVRLLEEWLRSRFRPADPKPLQEMIAAFKKIRRKRQRPAHALDEDLFDQEFFHEQRELMAEAYGAVRTLRLVLANHPRAKSYEVPEPLKSGKIRTF